VPAGLGEPVFDKIPADLAKAMMSINATKGLNSDRVCGSRLAGSEHNDEFYVATDGRYGLRRIMRGTLGGITTGENIHFGGIQASFDNYEEAADRE